MSTEQSEQAGAATQITETTLIARSPSALTSEVEGKVMMMSITRNRYFGLNETGSDIWRRIERPCSFSELVDHLTADYAADRETIAADVRAVVSRMLALDMVTLS
jgi:hypothetical protein